MKALALAALFVGVSCYAQTKPTSCLVIRHASTAHQFFISGANWQYVAGEFPNGMKWKSNLTDRNIRQIKEKGGHIIIIQPNYTASDLVEAQKACGVAQ